MLLVSVLTFAASACALAIRAVDECPPIPGGPGFVFGQPIEPVPTDVPNGCSEFEVLVGECDHFDDERTTLTMR